MGLTTKTKSKEEIDENIIAILIEKYRVSKRLQPVMEKGELFASPK